MERIHGFPIRTVAAVCAVVIGSVVLSSPADAGLPSEKIRMKISRNDDGPFGTEVTLNLTEGQAKNAYLKIRTITGQNEPAQLEQTPITEEFVINYFTKKGAKITNAVFSPGGYDFTVKPGKPKLFRVKVKQVEADVGNCFFPRARDDLMHNTNVFVLMNITIGECPS